MSWDIAAASEEWLIDLCHKANKEGGHIGGPMGGDQAVKLSDHIAAKFGLAACASEAAMQEFAYNTVDRNIVRIPKVYRYLESKKRDPHGYIFMEYIPGQNLQDVDLGEGGHFAPNRKYYYAPGTNQKSDSWPGYRYCTSRLHMGGLRRQNDLQIC